MRKPIKYILLLAISLILVSCGQIYHDSLIYKWSDKYNGWVVAGVNYNVDVSSIKKIVIPDTLVNYTEKVVKIGDSAFENSNFEEVILGKNIKEIGKNAFKNSKINKFIDLSNVVKIDSGAFYNTSIKHFEIPSTLLCIEKHCFSPSLEIKDNFTINIKRRNEENNILSKYKFDPNWYVNIDKNQIEYEKCVYLSFTNTDKVIKGEKLKLNCVLKDNDDNFEKGNISYSILSGNEYVSLENNELSFLKESLDNKIIIRAVDKKNNLDCYKSFSSVYKQTEKIDLNRLEKNIIIDTETKLDIEATVLPIDAKEAKCVSLCDNVTVILKEDGYYIKANKIVKDAKIYFESMNVKSKEISINVFEKQIYLNDNAVNNQDILIKGNSEIVLSCDFDSNVTWFSENKSIVIDKENKNNKTLKLKVLNKVDNGLISLVCDDKTYSFNTRVYLENSIVLEPFNAKFDSILFEKDKTLTFSIKKDVNSLEAIENVKLDIKQYKGLEKVCQKSTKEKTSATFKMVKKLKDPSFVIISREKDNSVESSCKFSFATNPIFMKKVKEKLVYIDSITSDKELELVLVDENKKEIKDVEFTLNNFTNSYFKDNKLIICDKYLQVKASDKDKEYILNLEMER